MTYYQKLELAITESNSLLCVGLDPVLEKLPEHLQKNPDGIKIFCKEIIYSTLSYSVAYKPNIAFFEAMGSKGWEILVDILYEIPKHKIVIADAKVGDIGNSSDQYAKTFFETYDFDAVTVAPYMGFDSVQPFLKNSKKGVYLLALTSNPGSANFQRQVLSSGKKLYEQVIETSLEWNQENLGYVVGATHPKELADIRQHIGEMPLLIPGIGAQGGDLEATVKAGINENNSGCLINVGRDIIYSSSGKDYAEKAEKKANDYQEKINSFRK